MAKLFKEEQDVLDALLREWYSEMHMVTERADVVFREKARQYDKSSPVWDRIAWPHGFVQELRKKTDRVKQLLDGEIIFVVNDDIEEELIDILNYCRMFAAINVMRVRRGGRGDEGGEDG